MKRLIDYLTPDRYRDMDQESHRRARLIVAAVLVANVATVIVSFLLCLIDLDLTATRVALTIPLQSTALLVLRYAKTTRVTGYYFMFVVLIEMMIDYGPDGGFGILVAPLLPLAAAAVLGPSAALVWTGVAVAWAGFAAPLWLRASDYTLELGVVASAIAVLVGLVAYMMERGRIVQAQTTRARLLANEQTMYRFVNSVFPAHAVADAKGIVEVSDGGLELLGYQRDEVMGLALMDLVHPDDRNGVLTRITEAPADTFHMEMRLRHKSGQEIWLEVFGAPMELDLSGKPRRRIFAGRDIREERRSRERAVRAQRLEGVGLLAAGVAHDFNNLLTVISGFSEMLPESEERTNILHAVEDATVLTSGLTAFGRGGVDVGRGVDVGSAVRKWEPMFRSLLGATVEVGIVLPSTPSGARVGDSELNQILLNLVTNAKEAMPDGGRVNIEVYRDAFSAKEAGSHGVQPGEYVCLRVTDTGKGMTSAVKERAFDPFYSTKEGARSSGLGLSSVYGIVTHQGGMVELMSGEGVGTEVVVMLPVHDTAEQHQELLSTGEYQSVRASQRILLVEDDPMVRTWLERSLSNYGFNVLGAGDGEEALQIASRVDVDLLLTDIIMPGMRGTELAARLRAEHPEMPILFVSAYADAEVSEWRNLVDGRVSFLAKPFRADALVAEIETLIRKRSSAAKDVDLAS